MAKILLIGLCIFALIHLHTADAKPGLRNRRYVEDDDGDSEDYNVEEVDSNDLRETRRIGSDSTYPPFPGGDNDWWAGEEDVSEEKSSPPVIAETEAYRNVPEVEEEPKEELHKKVVPWIKSRWGHAKSFFKKHYETAKNAIG